jgi:hypothetical protein
MIKFSFFLLLVIGCSIQQPIKIESTTIKVCNIFNDTSEIYLNEKPTILVFIKEPSCSGCKENLAIFLNKQGNKYNQYIITGKSESILNKKSYNLYLGQRFKKSIGTFYSLSPQSQKIEINSIEYNFNSKKNPFVLSISKGGLKIEAFNYEDIFEDVYIKETFKIQIRQLK